VGVLVTTILQVKVTVFLAVLAVAVRGVTLDCQLEGQELLGKVLLEAQVGPEQIATVVGVAAENLLLVQTLHQVLVVMAVMVLPITIELGQMKLMLVVAAAVFLVRVLPLVLVVPVAAVQEEIVAAAAV
jgi:hypothetical protein